MCIYTYIRGLREVGGALVETDPNPHHLFPPARNSENLQKPLFEWGVSS